MWWSQMTSVCIACRATSDFRLLHSGVAASTWPTMNDRAVEAGADVLPMG